MAKGSSSQPAQIIPAPPAPSAADTARQSAEAQLQYNPQLTAQSVALQQQYAPQLARSQYDVTAQMTPLYRSLLEQNYPQIPQLSQQVSERLASPYSLTQDQQVAQDAIRQRAYD